jgi:hypothetical protein
MGLSVILPPGTTQLRVEATWGDYKPAEDTGSNWVRTPQASARDLDLRPGDTATTATEYSLPNSQGLKIALAVRAILNPPPDSGIPGWLHSPQVSSKAKTNVFLGYETHD